jgi:glucokinase
LSTALDGAPTFLINDLEAMAYGVSALRENELVTLHEGAPTRGNACVIAAGTGLGQAGMYWDGRRHRPFATEGGHASFAPVNELQVELLLYLRRQFQHVSWERVVSGQGLVNVYHFIRDTRGGEEPEWLLEEMRTGDPAAAISKAAMAGKSEACEQALDLFVALYAEECGNAALKFMATGGIYLGGGIPPKILPRLTSSLFHGALTAKGRMRDVLEAMPVRVILNEDTGLIGAAVRGALQD